MRNNLIALGAVVLSLGVAAPVLASDFSNNERGPSFEERQAASVNSKTYGYQGKISSFSEPSDFRIIYLGELSRSEAASLKNASADKVQDAQAAAQADTGIASELNARGISVNSVVGVATPFNGRTIVYVK